MGLMKIATYYRRLGDDVTFFKGDLKELVLNNTYEALLKQLYANDDTIFWEKYKPQICKYISRGTKDALEEIYAKGKIPLIVGGTGFYIQSLLYDIDFTKEDGDQEYRRQLEDKAKTEGNDSLYEMLKQVDTKSS